MRINKYLLVFTSLSGFLGLTLFVVLQKYLPILLKHVVYYCQALGHSLSVRIPHQIGSIMLIALLFVISVLIVRLFISYLKIYLLRKQLSTKIEKNRIFAKLTKKLDLHDEAFLVKDKSPFAVCHGIRSPKIYISTGLVQMLTEPELEAVMRHEGCHLQERDSFIMLLASIAQSTFPFFPLLSDLTQNYRVEREIQADQEAVKGMSTSKHLIAVLKKMLSCDPAPSYSFAPAIADHDTLEQRIKALIKKSSPKARLRWNSIIISLFSVGLLFNLIMLPVQAVEVHGQEEDIMMVCLQYDSCSMWCKENETTTPYTKAPNSSVLYTPAQ